MSFFKTHIDLHSVHSYHPIHYSFQCKLLTIALVLLHHLWKINLCSEADGDIAPPNHVPVNNSPSYFFK